MKFLSLIESKREGSRLSQSEIKFLISEYVANRIPDYQMAAFLMAVFFRGLDASETAALTLAMRDSGEKLKFPKGSRPIVDKHSTGGVGDKVSLPLAPLLACLGFRVPMISGRGLGITGGTLDKLDSIPGFKTLLPSSRIVEIVQRIGCVICGQTKKMVPADRMLYALRDVTATVPSIPLITASILSKKLAENLDALILDVKFGRAAFMQTKADAEKLAREMVKLGKSCGVDVRAILNQMDTPLGCAAGNWLEVKESVACLKGEGPDDLRALVLECAAQLLMQTGKADSLVAGRRLAANCLDSGRPLAKWEEMLISQGANMTEYRRKLETDHSSKFVQEIRSPLSGVVTVCDAKMIGEVIRDLGGGRLNKESKLKYEVGLDRIAKPGQKIRKGDVLCRIHLEDLTDVARFKNRIRTAFEIRAVV